MIAVTGASGQLGAELCRQLGDEAVGLCRPDFDLADAASMEAALLRIQPDAVINAAAYTQVDRAESEPDLCMRINADAVRILADLCRRLDCPLVQVSTDYVFNETGARRTPYSEEDAASPRGVYANSKWLSEGHAAAWKKHFIVRTCGLYAASPGGPVARSNFVDTMLLLGQKSGQVRVVADQFCTPTYVPHLARAIRFLLGTEQYGLYHIVNGGSTTWFDFACEIFRRAGMKTAVQPISTAEFGAAAPRPAFSVLDTSKYRQLGGPEMPDWRQALEDYFRISNQ